MVYIANIPLYMTDVSPTIFIVYIAEIPRYMRVNLVKSSVEAVIEEFQSEGWSCIGKLDINK